ALGGGDHDPLHRPGRVAGDIQTREVRRLVLAGADRALLVYLASPPVRQVRLLRLAGGEEQRVALQRLPAGEDDALERAGSVEADDAILADPDCPAIEPAPLVLSHPP